MTIVIFANALYPTFLQMWVKDTSKVTPGKRRLADSPKLIDPSDVGRPTFFISCPWRNTVAKLFEALEGFLTLSGTSKEASEDTFVWIDW